MSFAKHFKWTLVLNLAILWGAKATSLEPFDLKKLSQRAKLVVYAKVLSVDTNERGQRSAKIDLLEVVRGHEASTQLVVNLLQKGSRRDGWIERVPDAVELKVGEEVLLFLNQSKSGAWVPVGLKQGKYRVVSDPRGVRRALSWKDGPINQISDSELMHVSRTALLSIQDPALSLKELENVATLSNVISQVQGFAK